jgi:hypothetical protein
MDRFQLKQYLDAAGVAEDNYLLVGLDRPRPVREGACIVRPNQRSWEVLVWQPARLAPSFTFLNEEQACDCALDILAPAGERRPVEAGSALANTELTPATLSTVGGLATSGKARLQL